MPAALPHPTLNRVSSRDMLPGSRSRHPILVALSVTLLLREGPAQVPAAPPPKAPADASDAFFKKGEIPRLDIEIAAADLEALKKEPRQYARADLVENRKTRVTGVGIRLKGSAGSYREWDDRPALTVKVDKFDKAQTWKALHKFHLNNSVQDDTYQHELLAGDVMRAAGVATPRVTHARVFLNGRDVGLYVLKEGFDQLFLSRHFTETTGNLYDGGFCQDIDADLQKDSGTGPDDRADLKALLAAAREPEAKTRWSKTAELLDTKAFATFMAMELMINHWDGYTMSRNNYRLYSDPLTHKFVFLAHGMDQVWRDHDASVLDMPPTILGSTVMKNPEWRAAYRKRLHELLPLISPPDRLLKRVDEVAARLTPVLEKMGPAVARDYEGKVRDLRSRIVARAKFLKDHVNQPDPKPIDFRTTPVVTLRGWRKAPETEDAQLADVRNAGERQYLIGCGKSGKCVASWRATAPLMRGRYRFSASVRTESVEPLPGDVTDGAGIRISAAPRTNRVVGTSSWKTLDFDFEVTEDLQDTEFVLELRATKGRALFNMDSLKLRKTG